MSKDTAIAKLLLTAAGEVGYLEKSSNYQLDEKTANAGSGNYTKYARDLDKLGVYNGNKNGYAWCDVFCDWCYISTFGLAIAMEMTGQPMGGYGAGCGCSVNYYKAIGAFHTGNPQPGDQIFFHNSAGFTHTGIVEKVDGGKVHTIEGNTSGASGVIANGGGVCRKSYAIGASCIGGYGTPKWALVPEQKAYSSGFSDVPDGQWYTEAVTKAASKGIMQGYGDGLFGPNDPLTRAQLAQALKNLGLLD